MTFDQLKDAVRTMTDIIPLVRPVVEGGLGLNLAEIQASLDIQAPMAVSAVVTAHPWPFCMRESSFTTTKDEAYYELRGESRDCRQVYALYYGDDEEPMDRMDQEAIDNINTDREIVSVHYWTLVARDNSQFPRVRLWKTPDATGDTVAYRYWRNDVNIEEFPTDFDYLLQLSLARRLNNSLDRKYKAELMNVARMWQRARKGPNPVRQDPHIERANRRRASLYTWKG